MAGERWHPQKTGEASRMPPSGLSLIGSRATGKTSVGRLVAGHLNWRFVDADQALEVRLGRSIASLFAEGREDQFRDEEERTLLDVTREPPFVLATGGGAVMREANRDALRRFGFVVWLKADPEVLARRLTADPGKRPSLTGLGLVEEVQSVLSSREPIYRALADTEIDTHHRSPEEVADAVLDAFLRWQERRS